MSVWSLPHFFRVETFELKETGDTSGIWPIGIPPCLLGPPGAWVPASWIWDFGIEVQSTPSHPDLMEVLHRLLKFLCPPPQAARIEN